MLVLLALALLICLYGLFRSFTAIHNVSLVRSRCKFVSLLIGFTGSSSEIERLRCVDRRSGIFKPVVDIGISKHQCLPNLSSSGSPPDIRSCRTFLGFYETLCGQRRVFTRVHPRKTAAFGGIDTDWNSPSDRLILSECSRPGSWESMSRRMISSVRSLVSVEPFECVR